MRVIEEGGGKVLDGSGDRRAGFAEGLPGYESDREGIWSGQGLALYLF